MGKSFISVAAIARVFSALLAVCLAACSSDAYDTGDGSLSYMRAEFVELSTDANAAAVAAVADGGQRFSLSPSVKASWITAKDSVYRALLYYNVPDGATGDAAASAVTVRPLAVGNVIVPKVFNAVADRTSYPTDPVKLESAWLSKNSRYVNLDLSIKVGEKDGETGKQSVGVAYVGSVAGADGTMTHRLVFVHGQNGVPEYYSSQVYVSIPLYRMPCSVGSGDKIEITIEGYGGKTVRLFTVG